MEYIGLCLTGYEILEGHLKREHIRKIREWGFDTLLVTFWWSFFERKERPYEYNEENLRIFGEGLKKIKEEGLKVIISGRVCYDPIEMPDWAGWATHDYVNLSDEGRKRYRKLWEMLTQRFPDYIYCPWHFPYHRQNAGSTQRDIYENITFPYILSGIREYSSNTVIYSPIYQGDADEGSTYYEYAEPYSDKNIVYALGHLIPWYVTDGGNWDYDIERMDRAFKGVKRFRKKGLPMVSIEYAPLYWNYSNPIHKSRLDCLRESIKRMRKYDVGYLYWRISLYQPNSDNILKDIENFEPTEVLDIIKPKTKTDNLEFIIIILIIIVILLRG